MIRIISWNIQAGGGSRVSKIAKKLIESQSTIIVLSEFRNNSSGIKIRNALLSSNYRHHSVSQASQNENSAAVFSQLPFENILVKSGDENYNENLLEVRFDAFSMIGGYFPHKKEHKLFDYCINRLENNQEPYLILGDLNSGINFIDQKGNSFWYEDKLKKMSKLGCKDAFRHLHKDSIEFSWYSHKGNGYRYDHIFADENILPFVSQCYYKHEWREEKLSDHSAMVIEIG